jgi:hypothetical protein
MEIQGCFKLNVLMRSIAKVNYFTLIINIIYLSTPTRLSHRLKNENYSPGTGSRAKETIFSRKKN